MLQSCYFLAQAIFWLSNNEMSMALMKVPGNINNIANTIVTVIYQKLVVLSENKESLKGSQ